ncbi:nuclear transcription factor Y subunit A-9-like [Bidens hawaiensis]|uniref:nuclear transcription factor Y subunit A-9-like n=1 Tax=Bidens hawaiensis TaxID=980011 RepID=UPI004049038A
MSFNNMQPSSFALDRESRSGCALIEEHDVVSQTTLNVPSVPSDIYGQQQFYTNYQQQQHQAQPNMHPVNTGYLNQAPQPDFFRHNIRYAPYPYYGRMMGAYGRPMIPPKSVDVPTKIALAPEIGPEPVFVNAKQYHAILRRRKSRAKAELEKKLIKERKTYIHESRHQHAMTRPRGSGGRFATREEVDSVKTTTSSSSKHVRPESDSETPRGEYVNSQSYLASPGYDFLSLDIGEDWFDISTSPNQG